MSKPIKPSKNQGDGFSDLKVQSVAVQSCFINNRECRSLVRERTLWEKHARNTGTE